MYRAESSSSLLNRIHLGTFVVAILGVALSAVFAVLNPAAFFPSYLVAFLYWTELSLGCLGFLLLINLVQGAWGVAVQRIMAAGARTLLLMVVLFLPLAFGVKKIYPWAMSNTFQGVTLHQPIHYLSVSGFLIRALAAFVIWGVLAFALSNWSYQHDTTNRTALLRWAGWLSGLGIVLYVITTSLAAFDWSMSLDPLWFSSVYGWLAIVREGLVAFSLAVIVLALFSKQAPVAAFLTQRLVNDLSKLLLANVMLWTYLHFFQFLIMWYGNLPRDIRWFVPRLADGWGIVVLLLLAFHFAVPFLWLIIPNARRTIGQLAIIGGLLLIMHLVEMYWLVLPAFRPSLALYPLDFILPIAMGSLWVTVFLWWLRGQHLLPVNHPLLRPTTHASHKTYETQALAS